MSLPHNRAIQTSRGICHRCWWLQNQSAIVLQQIRFNNPPASGLQWLEMEEERDKKAPAARSLPCSQATSQPGSPTLRWGHPRSAHTGASRGLRLGTQGRAGGNRISFCVHLLGLGRHWWESGAQTSSLWCLTVVQNFLTLITYTVALFFTTRRTF